MEKDNVTAATPAHAMADDALRVAVGTPEGRRSSTWRIWFGDADIYAAHRSIAHWRKVTIHYPRSPEKPTTLRYGGYTTHYAEKHGLPSSVQERAHAIWPGLEFAPDYFIEFRFRIPECELRRFTAKESEDTHWLKPPPPRQASEVSIVSGPPSHTGLVPQRAGGGDVELIGEFQLANGRFVWIMHHYIPFSASELKRIRLISKDEVNRRAGGRIGQILPSTRVTATLNCEDGTCAEVELAADFLRGGEKKSHRHR